MKKAIVTLAATLVLAVPVLAAAHSQEVHDQKCQKDCQMLVKNCGQEVDSLQQRIAKLKREIAKGEAAYTVGELDSLERKLQESEALLANLNFGG